MTKKKNEGSWTRGRIIFFKYNFIQDGCLLEAEIFKLLWEGWARARARAMAKARARAKARTIPHTYISGNIGIPL